MFKKIKQLLLGEEMDMQGNIFRLVLVVIGIAAVFGISECFIVMKPNVLIVSIFSFLILVMGIAQYVAFRYQKYEFAAVLMGLVIAVMLFPMLLCAKGGIQSGISVWLALGIIYMFIMFRGKKLVFFFALTCVVYAVAYAFIMLFPGWVIPIPSGTPVYFDAFYSVVVVGTISGLLLKVHMRMFEREHKLNIEQRQELERSRDARNIFFANMSHEIRTPINTILGMNELILRENTDEQIRSYAHDIQLAGKMLLTQVNDILDLSQMEMEKMKILPIQYKTADLFGELCEMIRIRLEKKGLEFKLDIDPHMPSVLLGDEKRIKQVLLNILDNAVKYTEQGSVSLSAHCEETGEQLVTLKVSVADTGIGIRKEEMDYLYDSFNRADEIRNLRIVGSGLGLAITKQLVDLMNGEITVDSIYTKGSVFTVSISQVVVDKNEMGSVVFRRTKEREGGMYKSSFEAPEARVLIVDDNHMNSMVAAKLLEGTKVQIDVVKSGAECLEMTKKKYYHVICMDYMMPVMSGLDTLVALRKQENGLCRESAVIALTGNSMAGAREECIEQGFDGYLEKPVQGKLLEREVLRFIPEDIIEQLENEDSLLERTDTFLRITSRRRKKIYITADCTCDIPKELLEKYDIKLMYLYIRTPDGRFADTREINSDSLAQYVTEDNTSAYVESGKVYEYEEFFAQALTEAESVIHISVASQTGVNYANAVTAAKGFDHVRVIDSEQTSGGMGMVTLYAAQMVQEGKSIDEICSKLEWVKPHISTQFIMPGAEIFHQSGRVGALPARICKMFQLRPIVAMRQKKAVLTWVASGSQEQARRKAIRCFLRPRRKISREIVYVTHVGGSVKEQEWLRKEIEKHIHFEKIIMQKSSFANACNSGIGAVGIAYYIE